MEDVTNEWLALQSYNGALRLNQFFIRGERPCNISYRTPLDPETENLIPGLLRLHMYGLLTYGSQPFQPIQRIKVDAGEDEERGWWREWHQRPYLCFLVPQHDRVPKQVIEEFTSLLLAHPDIATCISYGNRSCRTNITGDHVTTERKLAFHDWDLDNTKYWARTTIYAKYHHRADEWNVDAVTKADCMDISVASRSWDEDLDLLQLVENLAIEAGMNRAYSPDDSLIKPSPDIREETATKQEPATNNELAIKKETAVKKELATKKETAVKKEEE
ncbi:MAG: hypothetical protein Q9169_003328 [Polycauliona sp. 2 TL-2023]